jgi:hypothetical protein
MSKIFELFSSNFHFKEGLRYSAELTRCLYFENYDFYDVHQIERLLDADLIQDLIFNSALDSEDTVTSEKMAIDLDNTISNIFESSSISSEARIFYETNKAIILNDLIDVRIVRMNVSKYSSLCFIIEF